MKNIIIVLALFMSCIVFGQNVNNKQKSLTKKEIFKNRFINFAKTKKTIFKKSTKSTKERLDSTITEKWDKETNSWEETYKTKILYNVNEMMSDIIYSYLNEETEQWQEEEKAEITCDANGNMIKAIGQEKEWGSEWINDYKTELEYNNDGNIEYIIYSVWGEEDNKWIVEDKTEYVYNEDKKLITESVKDWNNETSQFEETMKYDFSYDSNGNLILEIRNDWDNETSQWKKSTKKGYSNDDSGNIIEELFFSWDSENSQWREATSKDEYTYDDNGNPIGEIYYFWDIDHWSSDMKYQYTYDLSKDLTDLIIPVLGFFLPDYDENITNKPVNYISYDFDSDVSWVNSDRGIYYYSTVNSSSVNDISGGFQIKVFPNPVTDYIQFDIDSRTNIKVEIFDIQGQEVLNEIMSSDKRISVSHLKKGLYIVKLNTNNKIYRSKIVVN